MGKDQLIRWFKLSQVNGLGPRKLMKLFTIFKNIDNIWDASVDDLLKSQIFKEKMIDDWLQLKNASSDKFEKILDECEQYKISIVPIFSKEYPHKLRLYPNPPVNLFLQGNKDLMMGRKVAIVGSRKSDNKSRKWAYDQAVELAKKGIVIVSGGAFGIDIEAHKAALSANGKTICVMGTGFMKMYPQEHIPIFNEIREKGLLVTENLPSFPGSKIAFLQRNRMTSGLSDAIIVVTSLLHSGVMNQMKHAFDQRVPIFSPKINFRFDPFDGIINKKKEYHITEIDDYKTVLSAIDKEYNSDSFLNQSLLF